MLARLAWWRQSDLVTGAGAGGEAGENSETPGTAGEMAFGLVQLGLAAAALGLGEVGHEILTWLAGAYWRPSLVPTHNAGAIFNVDIAGGFPALVAALLLASCPGHLTLLPALPTAWPRGEITGLAGRGQVAVERLTWSPQMVSVRVSSPRDQRIRLTVGRWDTAVDLPAGVPVDVTVELGGLRGRSTSSVVSADSAERSTSSVVSADSAERSTSSVVSADSAERSTSSGRRSGSTDV